MGWFPLKFRDLKFPCVALLSGCHCCAGGTCLMVWDCPACYRSTNTFRPPLCL